MSRGNTRRLHRMSDRLEALEATVQRDRWRFDLPDGRRITLDLDAMLGAVCDPSMPLREVSGRELTTGDLEQLARATCRDAGSLADAVIGHAYCLTCGYDRGVDGLPPGLLPGGERSGLELMPPAGKSLASVQLSDTRPDA